MEINSLTSSIGTAFQHFQFGAKAQLAFLEDLYVLIKDGIPPNRAVEMMAQVTTGISRNVADSIGQKISEGQALAEGMREWFAPNVIEIIRVGEEGGALAETMRSAVNTLTASSSTWSAFFAAIFYPIMVISLACGIIVYLNGSVFDQFKALKPMDQWPDAGKQLVVIAEIIQGWWWLVLLFVGATIFILRKFMDNYTGDVRGVLDRIFPFSLYRRFAAARLMETLGLLVVNGVVFKNAIKVMQYQANPYVASHLVLMEQQLSMGKGNIADVLNTGLIDQADILRLRVMAEVKGFEHGLTRMGLRGAEQTTKTLRLIGKIFGGALLGVGAGLIIVIIRGIYLTGMSMGAS